MQVIWCYGNIAGESLALRNSILMDGVVVPMALALDQAEANSSAMRNISWCLANFMKGDELPQYELVAPGIPALIRALQRTELEEVIVDVTWGFSFITRESNQAALNCMVANGSIPKLL